MSGPIIRSGASAQFSMNWGNVFSQKKSAKLAAAKPSPKKKAGKKSAKKK